MTVKFMLQPDGTLLAARFAYMPNKLRYCGGDKAEVLLQYLKAGQSDPGLTGLLSEFQTMYPYLRLIAEANKILNPFDWRVVEAYWIGNELLENVSMEKFYRYLVDEQKLKKRFKLKLLEQVFGKIPAGARPHHNWHVFNLPKRTGHYPVEHNLCTMDECRIAVAQVKSQKSKVKSISQKLKVFVRPLISSHDKVLIGEMAEREVWAEGSENYKAGDLVAVHWGWVCGRLNETQAGNLEKWTEWNLRLVNT